MMKRVISLALCLLMVLSVFAGCAKKDESDKGAYVTMYLTDPIYNFDPAFAYNNEAALKIVSLMFDTLFVLDDNGKVKKSLAKDYDMSYNAKDDVYEMIITLNETCWSDGMPVRAENVLSAWQRILDPSNSFEAAVLLYDIQNAREAKEGKAGVSVDDVGISAVNETQLKITFDEEIDEERFLLNLTSYALAPIRDDVISQAVDPIDWAKSPTIFLASGPFKLKEVSYDEENAGLVLERNMYYYRDTADDALDKSVTPYRLIVDYTMSDEEIMQAYSNGELFYVGNIPLSVRGNWKAEAEITDAMSTHSYILNENALIAKNGSEEGELLFANADVRKALSLAIDREAIAEAIVFAKAATGLVPYGVFDQTSKKDLFREVGSDLLATSANISEANKLLADAGVTASDYSFAITVPSYDDVHMEIAKMVEASWKELGFQVTINALGVIDNDDIDKTTEEVIPGIKDDLFAEALNNETFEVIAIDYTALSADAFSVLAPFAKHFTGNAYIKSDAVTGQVLSEGVTAHRSGFDNEEYNTLIEDAFAATSAKDRAGLLHDAEELLMEQLPIIPIVFNQNAILVHENLSKVSFSYYGAPQMAKMKLKNYELYIPESTK